MAFEFLTLVGKLRVLDSIFNYQLFQDPDQLFDKNQKPCQYYTELFEYGKDNYWDKDKKTDQTVNLAI